ncbi:MAG: hypothetical protein WCC45_18035, partial [Paeniglutamicibacter sp.]
SGSGVLPWFSWPLMAPFTGKWALSGARVHEMMWDRRVLALQSLAAASNGRSGAPDNPNLTLT